MTCSICPASARTGQRSGARDHHQVDVLANHAGQHLDVFCRHVVQVDDPGRQHLLPAEGEQLARQRRGAFRRAGDFLRWTAQGRLSAQALEEKFRVARNHHQEIVEIVRDAARQPADCFHLLRLAQLLLQHAAFGHILRKQFEHDSTFSAVGNRAAGNANQRRCGVFAFPFRRQSLERLC